MEKQLNVQFVESHTIYIIRQWQTNQRVRNVLQRQMQIVVNIRRVETVNEIRRYN